MMSSRSIGVPPDKTPTLKLHRAAALQNPRAPAPVKRGPTNTLVTQVFPYPKIPLTLCPTFTPTDVSNSETCMDGTTKARFLTAHMRTLLSCTQLSNTQGASLMREGEGQ